MPITTGSAQYPSLRDRVVLITGGASGIGASMVEHFARQGAKVAFLDVDDSSAANLKRELSSPHPPFYLHCDLTDTAIVRAAVAEIEQKIGPIRVLVNNAARDERHKFAEVTPEYWDERIAVNLRHQFFVSQAVVP